MPRESTFFVTGGTLRHDAPSYVERQADKDLLDGLLNGEFCYVLTSRQMGKSSLMVRNASKLREQSIAVVVLDLTAAGQNLTAEQWYHGLLVLLGRQLGLENELEEYWDSHPKIGPCQRFFDAIRDIVFPKLSENPKSGAQDPGSLVVFVDEIDTVRSLPFSTDEFFAGIRACYNRRTEEPEFDRLSFCLLGVAMPSDLIGDTRLTPFNVGRRIELNDFTGEEAAALARGLERVSIAASPLQPFTVQQLLQRALYWTNGHPYLTQRLCGAVLEHRNQGSEAQISPHKFIDQICGELFFSTRARERDDNLIFVREHLLRSGGDRGSLLHFYEKVLRGGRVPDDEGNPLVSVLRLAGVVRVQAGLLRERNRIYERVFDKIWVQANMPGAEIRRQRAAFLRGVLRATGIAAVVVGVMIVMVLIAVNQAAKARTALAQSYLSQARAGRLSGLSGQRYESLNALREAREYHAGADILRDEMIACLALADLREKTNRSSYSLQDTNASELNLDLGVSATAEMAGSVALRNLKDGQLLRTLPGFGLPVRQLRFAPPGSPLPSAGGRAGGDGLSSILLAEYHAGREKNRLLTPSAARKLREGGPALSAFEKEGQERIVIWDWQRGEKLFEVPHGIHAGAIDFSAEPFPKGAGKLAVGQKHGRVVIYALPQGEILRELELKWESGSPRAPQVLRFSPSGDLLAESCLDDLNVQIWDLNTGRKILRLYHPEKVYDLSWHPQGDLLATACGDACIYLWDTNRTDKPMKKLIGHENDVKAIAFNHRGTLLASAGMDETLRLWTPATDRQVARRLEGETFDRLQFSSTDHVLIASGDRESRAWEVFGDEYIVLQVRAGLADKLKSIDFSPDGRWLAAASGERTMIWDYSSGRELGSVNLAHAHSAAFSADSRHLVGSTDEGLFQYPLHELKNGNQVRLQAAVVQRVDQVPDELGAMALSLDRTTAVLVHQDEVRLVALAAGTNSTGRALPVGSHYHWLAFHPQGRWMAAMIKGSDLIDIWNLSTNADARTPFRIPGSEYFFFSPDGKWLVTCWSGQFQFYRVGAWEDPAFVIPRIPESNQHAPIAFTRDGDIVALASSRYTIHLLKLGGGNPTTFELIGSLESPDRSLLELLAFSPNGRQLAAATANLTIQIWNLALLRESLAELNLDHNWPKYR